MKGRGFCIGVSGVPLRRPDGAAFWAGFLPALVLTLSVHAATPHSVDLGRLPLAFEPNRGQGQPTAQFLARGAGYDIGVRAGQASLHFRGKGGKQNAISIRFAGASASARPVPSDALPGKVNYFIGSDPKKWHADIPTYARIEYAGVYPGVGLVYYGNQGRLEFDFRVQPGADPAAIRIVFDGAERALVDSNGDLVMGDLRQHRPDAYQVLNGGERRPVDCRYVMGANHEVKLAVGAYDRSRLLVIDPVLSYATYLGGAGNEGVASVKVDASGNLYVAGFTSSTTFPIRGAEQGAYAGTNSPLLQAQFGDAFVAKLNPGGTALIYATYLGGSGDDFATSLAIDAAGNAYVAGATQSFNFPTTAGAFQKSYKGFTAADDNGFYDPGDGFVVKLNPAGNQLVYATYLGGTLNDMALGIAVDSSGDAVVVGSTESSDFPTTANALTKTFRGAANFGPSVAGDGFISILNPAGTALTYSTFLGGRGHDGIKGVAVDAQNNIYVCGVTFSGDFPVTSGAFQTTFRGLETSTDYNNAAGDGFVAKFSAQGSLVYATYLGGGFRDAATAIAVDSTGAAYVTGNTSSTDFPTTANAPQRTYKGSGAYGTVGDAYRGDAFVSKLNPAGSALVYSTYLGGAGDEGGLDIAVDGSGNAFVVGFTTSPEFPVTADALQPVNAGLGGQGFAANPSQGFDTERVRNTGDAFLVKLSAAGSLAYSSFFGGNKDDAAAAVAVDAAGSAYVAGGTLSSFLPTSSGAVQPAFGGSSAQWPRGDGFIAKFDFGGKLPGTAAAVNIVAGFTAAGSAGTGLPAPFTVQVVDAGGLPVPGVQVAFTATGATVNPASVLTDSQGRASTTVTLGPTPGSGTVTATVTGLPSASTVLTINAAGPAITSVQNGASFQDGFAANAWLTIKGANLAAVASDTWDNAIVNGQLPTKLDGVSVTVGGQAAYVYYVSPTQINVVAPNVAPGATTVVVKNSLGSSAGFDTTGASEQPAFFPWPGGYAVASHTDYTYAVKNGTFAGLTTVPAKPNDYVILWGTAFGATSPSTPVGVQVPTTTTFYTINTVTVTVGGVTAPVYGGAAALASGFAALFQVVIQVPGGLADGDYPVVATVNGVKSPVTAMLTVQH